MAARPKDTAVLVGFDSAGSIVFDQSTDLHDYWDETHPVIDESAFRAGRGIRKLVGKLYGGSGNLIEEFENNYGPSGELQTSHSRHEDGTETWFPPR